MSILLYGCTTWMLTKRMEKKLGGNYSRMLQAILNKSWRKHPTKQPLYGHLPPITKTIQVRRTRHTRHCWRSEDELISDILQWTNSRGRAKAGRPVRTYIEPSLEDLPRAMDDRDRWRDKVREMLVARHDDDDDEVYYGAQKIERYVNYPVVMYWYSSSESFVLFFFFTEILWVTNT